APAVLGSAGRPALTSRAASVGGGPRPGEVGAAFPSAATTCGLRPSPSSSQEIGEPVIETDVVERVLSTALRSGGEFAEVFVEDKRSSSAVLDDGKIEELTSGRDRGAGIRVVRGETTGFAHTADLTEDGLRTAAEAAAAAARGGSGGTTVVDLSRQTAPRPNEVAVAPEDVAKATKVELLTRADRVAREQGSAITQVMARYGDS